MRYALRCEVINEGVIGPACHVVEVVHADYLGYALSLRQLRGTDSTEAKMMNQPLVLEFGQHGQKLCY